VATSAVAQTGVIFEVGKYDSNIPSTCPDSRNEGRCGNPQNSVHNMCNASCSYYNLRAKATFPVVESEQWATREDDTVGPDGPNSTAWKIIRPPVAAVEVAK
jgi:hypothetical protein